MESYYDINNNYKMSNNYGISESDNLDRLARSMNKKKDKLFRKVSTDFDREASAWKNGMDTILNTQHFSYLPMNNNHQDKLYSGNIDPYSDSEKRRQTVESDRTPSEQDSLSDSEFSCDTYNMVDTKSIDPYLDSAISNENENNNFSKIVNSISYDDCSNGADNIFEHIKHCNNCKKKLIDYLNGNPRCEKERKRNKKTKDIKAKEIIALIIIGLFIIMILDILIGIRR